MAVVVRVAMLPSRVTTTGVPLLFTLRRPGTATLRLVGGAPTVKQRFGLTTDVVISVTTVMKDLTSTVLQLTKCVLALPVSSPGAALEETSVRKLDIVL